LRLWDDRKQKRKKEKKVRSRGTSHGEREKATSAQLPLPETHVNPSRPQKKRCLQNSRLRFCLII
jgi:hypothetical protein